MKPLNLVKYNIDLLKEINDIKGSHQEDIDFSLFDNHYHLMKRAIALEVKNLDDISKNYSSIFMNDSLYQKFSKKLGYIIRDVIAKKNNETNSIIFYDKKDENNIFIFDIEKESLNRMRYIQDTYEYQYFEETEDKDISYGIRSTEEDLIFNKTIHEPSKPDWLGLNLSLILKNDLNFVYIQDTLNESYERNFLQINDNYYRSEDTNYLLENLDLFCDAHYSGLDSSNQNWLYNQLSKNISFKIRNNDNKSFAPVELFFDVKLGCNEVSVVVHNHFSYNDNRPDFTSIIKITKEKNGFDIDLLLDKKSLNFFTSKINKDSISDLMDFIEINNVKRIPSCLYPLLINIEPIIDNSTMFYNNISENVYKSDFMNIIYNKSQKEIKIINEKLIRLLYNNDSISYIGSKSLKRK